MFGQFWKHFCYVLEFIGTAIFYLILRLLPFKWSSAVSGKIAHIIGPLLPVSDNARRNLKRVYPDIQPNRIEEIVNGMWENLGRTIGEYPHLHKLDIWGEKSPVEIVNADLIEQLRDDGKPAILFLGHIANWEYATLGALQKGLKVTQLYRTLNNPYVAWLVHKVHGAIVQEKVAKGSEGARQSLAVLRRGGHLSILIDQKFNEGRAIPFLGIEAMTSTALARLALKFQCPVVPVRVERLHGIQCRVTYYPPLALPKEGNSEHQVYELMCAVNRMLSEWITERPQDWMWVHNRWPNA
jgi:KDO2-lipid IV(A) lauroyltransferase